MRHEDKFKAQVQAVAEWLRARHGRSVQAARAIGRSPQLIAEWMAGRCDPKVPDWYRLLEYIEQEKAKEAKAPRHA